ncbi:LPXTG cell wall anchor domain-containing protein [Papillibacter cinnamivorans]|uniref:LPXTG-motif cell wall anchor domain-containing protein n=1 Tax=Papillibacter cinnamivorans DSM 12816 TaxID=1122930 RepID=A0A1W2BGI8_9FIRM|nr:LPXTG cell wall anchor domain-containing protein [Papillibacter cinnamivorans]SMC72049.1 LPXTG-motif cell wall anchor domain-containing protein [Papillibacter cinnamivorans DSM 12816]
MKKKLKSYLALLLTALMLSAYLGGVATAVVAPYTSAGTGVGDPSTGTHSLEFANIVLFKQATRAFVWVSGAITDSDATIKARIRASDDSVKNYLDGEIFIIRADSFSGATYMPGDSQYEFTVTINQTPTTEFPKGSYTIGGKDVSHVGLYMPMVPTGSLTVTKTVNASEGTTVPAGGYRITVTFTGTVTGITNDQSFSETSPGSGVYEFYLAGGTSVKFSSIPLGTMYTVDESVTGTGWSKVSIADNSTVNAGTVTALNLSPTVTVTNAYTVVPPPTPGTLTVTKTVNASEGTTVPAGGYQITVTFPGTVTGITNDKGFTETTTGSGVYEFYLAGGASVIFSNIPQGTAYKVEESVTDAGWSMTGISSNSSGSITAENLNPVVTITNLYDPQQPSKGTLTVTKAVNTSETTVPAGGYLITVTFPETVEGITNNKGLTVKTVDSVAMPGVYEFYLAKDESVTFSNIPQGTTYTVEESVTGTGWSKVSIIDNSTSHTGSIAADNLNPTVTVTNAYTVVPPPPVYGLTVNKVVNTNAATVPAGGYLIKVTFTGTGLKDITNDKSFTETAEGSGVYEFYLAGGASVIFSNIPADTAYVVSESVTGAGWGTPAFSSNYQGAVTAITQHPVVVVTNTYTVIPPTPGTLTVSKTVAGTTSLWNGSPFVFRVTFDKGMNTDYSYESNSNVLNLGYTDDADESGVTFTFSLSNGEWIEFYNIQAGTAYTVTETNAQGAAGTSTSGDPTSGTFTALQGDGIYYVADKTVAFTNTYTSNPPPPPGYYDLTVAKAIEGTGASTADTFSFSVTLANYYGVSYAVNEGTPVAVTSGTTSLTLRGGDAVVFQNILEGTGFSATETDSKDYTLSIAASAGVTVAGANASGYMNGDKEVTFTNTKEITTPPPSSPPPAPSPSTGVLGATDDKSGVAGDTDTLPKTDGISTASALAILGMMMTGTGAVLGFKKKKENDE